jgi:hypothetical protein
MYIHIYIYTHELRSAIALRGVVELCGRRQSALGFARQMEGRHSREAMHALESVESSPVAGFGPTDFFIPAKSAPKQRHPITNIHMYIRIYMYIFIPTSFAQPLRYGVLWIKVAGARVRWGLLGKWKGVTPAKLCTPWSRWKAHVGEVGGVEWWGVVFSRSIYFFLGGLCDALCDARCVQSWSLCTSVAISA